MRSTVTTIVTIFDSIKEHITPEHLEVMRRTPFHILLDSLIQKRIDASICKKHDGNVITIIKLFNPVAKTVKLGYQNVGFTIADVKYIFGIVDGEKPIAISKGGKKQTDFVDRIFGDEQQIQLKFMKEKLKKIVKEDTRKSIEDVVRLLCLILIASLFCCTSGVSILWGWIEYVEDIDRMRDFDWCSVILDMLLDSMVNKQATPNKVTCCTVFLLYWICEHTSVLEKRNLSGQTQIPRLVKWNLPDLKGLLTKKRIMELKRNEVVEVDIEPTLMEL